jgi:hypothetical protein
MALGDVIGEANGSATNIEVLSVEGGSPRIKVTLRGTGKAKGVGFTDLITYTQVQKSEGILFGDGETVCLTDEGEICTWKGFGVGRPTSAGGAASFAVAGWFDTKSSKLASLNGVACIIEFETDDNGSYHWTAYEWKHPTW